MFLGVVFSLSSALTLTTENILRVLEGLQWDKLCVVLGIPSFQRGRIKRDFASEDRHRIAAVHFYLHNHPYASWRHIIGGLDYYNEHHEIHHHAEKLTGIFQHLLLCVIVKLMIFN